MRKPQNLFLVGPMGAGKSAVGRQLARTLHLNFMDSDDEIEARTGVDIPFIFEKEGEEGFRKREAKVIDDLSKIEGLVLATGGGAVLDAQSRSFLGARGFVVYLYTRRLISSSRVHRKVVRGRYSRKAIASRSWRI